MQACRSIKFPLSSQMTMKALGREELKEKSKGRLSQKRGPNP
ncbi:MAG: hypothetical protein ACP5I6_07085 [Caldisphaera sp.]